MSFYKKFDEERPKEDRFLGIKTCIIIERCSFFGAEAFRNEYGHRIDEDDILYWTSLPELPKELKNDIHV